MKSERLPRAVNENLIIRELDDETLVYDLGRDKAHCLNHTAGLVWKMCDGERTAEEAARLLQRQFDVKIDADLVWLAVKQLQRYHLVEGQKKLASVSRRSIVLKYAPMALAVPAIISITAPTAFAAASCLPPGAPCSPSGTPCCSPNSCFGSFPTCQLG